MHGSECRWKLAVKIFSLSWDFFFSYMDIISIVWCNKTLKIEKLLSYSDLSLKQHLLFYIIAIRPLFSHFIRLSIVVNLLLTCFYLFSCHSFIHGSFLSPHQLSLSIFFNNDDLTLFHFLFSHTIMALQQHIFFL